MDPTTQMAELLKNILQPITILSVVGAIVSLFSAYMPGFREWYAKMETVKKSLIQLVVVTVLILLAGILSWTGVVPVVTNDMTGIFVLIMAWIGALTSNQAAYVLAPETRSVKEAIAERDAALLG
jgi:hypothetical protein